jgi:hypothetical protein
MVSRAVSVSQVVGKLAVAGIGLPRRHARCPAVSAIIADPPTPAGGEERERRSVPVDDRLTSSAEDRSTSRHRVTGTPAQQRG